MSCYSSSTTRQQMNYLRVYWCFSIIFRQILGRRGRTWLAWQRDFQKKGLGLLMHSRQMVFCWPSLHREWWQFKAMKVCTLIRQRMIMPDCRRIKATVNPLWLISFLAERTRSQAEVSAELRNQNLTMMWVMFWAQQYFGTSSIKQGSYREAQASAIRVLSQLYLRNSRADWILSQILGARGCEEGRREMSRSRRGSVIGQGTGRWLLHILIINLVQRQQAPPDDYGPFLIRNNGQAYPGPP